MGRKIVKERDTAMDDVAKANKLCVQSTQIVERW